MTEEQAVIVAPFYRKRWFVTLTLFLISPIALLSVATGPIFEKKDGSWVEVQKSTRTAFIIIAAAFSAGVVYAFVSDNG